VKIPKPGEMRAASELMKKILPVAQELNAALDNLAEVYEQWLKDRPADAPGEPDGMLSAAVQRVLAAHETKLSAL
jgi:hypothetical protein